MADRVPKQAKGQHRWRAGKAPEWIGAEGQAREEDEQDIGGGKKGGAEESQQVRHDATDRRLRRLAEGRREGTEPRYREVTEAKVVMGDDEEGAADDEGGRDAGADSDTSDEEQVEARRERMRALAKQRAAKEEAEAMPLQEEEQEEGGSSSSWEYESESESDTERRLVKPVFVSASGRATIEQREAIEREKEAEEEGRKKREEQRKAETRKIVADELHKEHIAQQERENKQVHEDTESDGNEEEEFDKWRIRELKRIKRYREEREQWDRERADVERRRKMTDEQVMQEDAAMGKGKKARGQMVFMQKYHHKGAFFMENDAANQFKEKIYNRDTNDATDADKATAKLATDGPHEKSKVLQVRRGEFGKMGQTKWTHLTAEDTTNFDSPWAADDSIRRKIQGKLGGMAKDRGRR